MKLRGVPALLILAAATSAYLPYPTKAASQDECSIWLCLPTGFPSGCGEAKSAMKKRLKKGKSPMPDFGECSVTSPGDANGGGGMFSRHGVAAYIPPQNICTEWKIKYGTGKNGQDKKTCVKFETVPEKYVKGTSCQRYGGGGGHTYVERPKGCTKTVNWAEVWQGQEKFGDTYLW